jgi:nucleoid-associated protein YgaU
MKSKLFKFFFVLALLVFTVGNAIAQRSYNYEEMEMDQYNGYLSDWQARLDNAKQGIADEQQKIDELKTASSSTQDEIEETWSAIFEATNKSKTDYDSYVNGLNDLKGDARALLSMSPEEIYRKKTELEAMQADLDKKKQCAFSVISDNEKLINEIESLLTQANDKGTPAVPPTYTVVRGDYLWKIAANADIYNNAYAWMRIYTSNRDQIKDPNLIFPNQIFNIPRDIGPNEHLVAKGENLSKIAGYSNIYGSAFRWQKLYEANKSVIADPNMVYPHTVLKIAR